MVRNYSLNISQSVICLCWPNCYNFAINYKNCPYHPRRLLPTIMLWVLTRATTISSTPYLFVVNICPKKRTFHLDNSERLIEKKFFF